MWYHLSGSQIISVAPCHIERCRRRWRSCRSCCLRPCPALGQDTALGAGSTLGMGRLRGYGVLPLLPGPAAWDKLMGSV